MKVIPLRQARCDQGRLISIVRTVAPLGLILPMVCVAFLLATGPTINAERAPNQAVGSMPSLIGPFLLDHLKEQANVRLLDPSLS